MVELNSAASLGTLYKIDVYGKFNLNYMILDVHGHGLVQDNRVHLTI